MPGFGDADLRRHGPILRGQEQLPDDKPVEAVHLHLHPRDLLDSADRFAGQDAERKLLHPRCEVVEAPKEAVDRESGRLHEILDRDEPRALVDDRQSREAADGLVNLLKLGGGELVPAADLDRVATDDVVAGDETRQRLGTGPVVGVDGRLRRAGILLKRPDSDSQGTVVLDRQVHDGPGEDAVRFGPGLREGDSEARIPEFLDLPALEFHGGNMCRLG